MIYWASSLVMWARRNKEKKNTQKWCLWKRRMYMKVDVQCSLSNMGVCWRKMIIRDLWLLTQHVLWYFLTIWSSATVIISLNGIVNLKLQLSQNVCARPSQVHPSIHPKCVTTTTTTTTTIVGIPTCNRPRANYFIICALGTSVTLITSFVIFLRALSSEKY